MATPGSESGRMISRKTWKGAGAHVARRFQDVLVDLGERKEDRPDAQHDIELRQRHRVAELGIQEEGARLVDNAQIHQHLVEQAAPAEHRQPGDGADQVAGPERHHRDQEQRQLPFEILHLHRQEKGDRIADDQADDHHRDGEAEGRPQGRDENAELQEIAVLGVEKPFLPEEVAEIDEREVRRHAAPDRRPETEHDDADQRDDEKDRSATGLPARPASPDGSSGRVCSS